ncbi:hypothetical protein HaLaN_06053 [Haematococcus lacustris]|uniref:Uncharacterized protein n=1 Tax=Haematococcus lacustris TaxID=44745 RepID=A0A699YV56_HAELA|nr:hypothetical protein HaLaN_06053 [Haematococcus lacustris]
MFDRAEDRSSAGFARLGCFIQARTDVSKGGLGGHATRGIGAWSSQLKWLEALQGAAGCCSIPPPPYPLAAAGSGAGLLQHPTSPTPLAAAGSGARLHLGLGCPMPCTVEHAVSAFLCNVRGRNVR